jgi:hypothetical protein
LYLKRGLRPIPWNWSTLTTPKRFSVISKRDLSPVAAPRFHHVSSELADTQ